MLPGRRIFDVVVQPISAFKGVRTVFSRHGLCPSITITMAKHARAFESIESAYQFLDLLLDTVRKEAVAAEKMAATSSAMMSSRHRDALRLVDYKLRSLTNHLSTSRRLVNDLRTLRRYLLDERNSAPVATADELMRVPAEAVSVLHPNT
jgi:hypothetical protein